jgi:glycosyltransferase involved in cell wall biosynthesis
MLSAITPVLLTYNEAPNIGRALSMLTWARDIVVVDSMSSDETGEIARSFPQVRFFLRQFDNHAAQWNYALTDTGITTEWVLALDADYILSQALVAELQTLQPAAHTSGFETGFQYCIYGRALRGSTYGPVVTLFRKAGAHYVQDGHTQRVRLPGAIEKLEGSIQHDDRKSVACWCEAQNRYMALEADKLCRTAPGALQIQDRIRRRIFLAPMLMLFYCAFVKGNILDGKAGLYYVCQRTAAELLLSLHLLQRRLGGTWDKH